MARLMLAVRLLLDAAGDGPGFDLVIGFVAVLLPVVLAIMLSEPGGREIVWQTIGRRIAAAFAPDEVRRMRVASRPVAASQPTTAPADWYRDPTNGWVLRYWDGAARKDRFAFDQVEPPPVDD